MKKQILAGLIFTLTTTSVFAATKVIGNVVQKGNQIIVGGKISCSAKTIADTNPIDPDSQVGAEYKLAVQTESGFTIRGTVSGQTFIISGDPVSETVTFNLNDTEAPKNRLRTSSNFSRRGFVTLGVSRDGLSTELTCVQLQ
jgi:hypothetical protein